MSTKRFLGLLLRDAVVLFPNAGTALQYDRRLGCLLEAVAGDDAAVEAVEPDGGGAGPDERVAGDDDVAEGGAPPL